MAHVIVKLKDEDVDYYLMWSTVVDSPITAGLTLEQLKEYYKSQYGEIQFEMTFESQMKRVNEKGVSYFLADSVEEFISHNRAGESEKCLTYEEIVDRYCKNIPE